MGQWTLRRARMADVDVLHALLRVPEVYEFLVDGVAPPREGVVAWLDRSEEDFAKAGLGIWLLEDGRGSVMGCVRLTIDVPAPRDAELTYLLHPDAWGRGLATRMGVTVIDLAFASGAVDRLWAGADGPNARSIAVMERLGMRFWRDVVYPLGPGVEYELFPEAVPVPRVAEPIPVWPEAARAGGAR